MAEFGIFAKDLLCKVTIEPTHREKVTSIPCSIGFKQKDGSWVNEFVDVLLFKDNLGLGGEINKGDKIKVTGRMNLSEYKDKKKWSIFADYIFNETVRDDVKQGADLCTDGTPLDDGVPF